MWWVDTKVAQRVNLNDGLGNARPARPQVLLPLEALAKWPDPQGILRLWPARSAGPRGTGPPATPSRAPMAT
jgi:hypothetical protein